MKTNLLPSDFNMIEREYSGEIIEIRNGTDHLLNQAGFVRKTIVFSDFARLSCTEIIKDGQIEYYRYDYYQIPL